MKVSQGDMASLMDGKPPADAGLVNAFTVREEAFLRPFSEHYLENFIPQGGSKVKLLVGGEGSGKSHCLRWIEGRARDLGYATVSFSMREVEWKFSNLAEFFKEVVRQVDRDGLIAGLCRHVAAELGYHSNQYDGSGSILPLLMEMEGLSKPDAEREVRKAASKAFSTADLSQSFKTFAASVVRSWMTGETEAVHLCYKWISGEKLLINEKKECELHERLTRVNARQWIYSLLRLIRLSGKRGLVLLVDDLEAITGRHPDSLKYRYTPNAAKDTYELIRQLIDDCELLEYLLVVLSGNNAVVHDDRRGFKSYQALWMRLQTGLVDHHCFNMFADMVNLDNLLEELGEEFPKQVKKRLREVFDEAGLSPTMSDLPDIASTSPLRNAVRETAGMTQKEGI